MNSLAPTDGPPKRQSENTSFTFPPNDLAVTTEATPVDQPPGASVAQLAFTEFEAHFDLVACLDLPDLRMRWVNSGGRGFLQLGTSESDAELPLDSWVDPATARTLGKQALSVRTEGRVWHGRGTLLTRSGAIVPVRLGLTRLVRQGEILPFALLTAIDDTHTRNLQTVLRNEQLLLHALLGTTRDAIYFKDLDGRYIRASKSLAERLGVGLPENLIGQTDANFLPAEQAARLQAREQAVARTLQPQLEEQVQKNLPDGRIIWVATSTFPLRDWRGEIVGTFGLSRDITAQKIAERERQNMEEQLVLAQKMESIGRLAAGVAHEVNTPTQFISDNTHFLVGATRQIACVCAAYRALLEQARTVPELRDAVAVVTAAEEEAELDYLLAEMPRTLNQSIDGLGRVGRIVESLREFSHPGEREKSPANLNHALEMAVAVSRHEWKLVADVVTQLDPDLPTVPCVLDDINQVILNLIINAAHAIAAVAGERPNGRGRITLRSRRDGPEVVIEVEDDGAGIPESSRSHIFEPFFTTKPVGQGTGQGLALVHTMVVKNHRGRVGFTTKVGRGTTFWFRLPVTPPDPGPDAATVATAPSTSHLP